MPKDLSEYKDFSIYGNILPTYTIYGSSGTYVEEWANKNEIKFIEVTPETAVITDLPKYYKPYMGELEADVVGFNRQYQWYANDVNSNEGGTPIEGATGKTFNPADYYAPYYYCVVTSKDGDFDPITIKTSACENRTVKLSADYSCVDLALSKVPADLSGYTKRSRDELTKAIEAVEYNLDKTRQDKVNKFAKDIETAINNLELISVKLDKTEVDLHCDDSLKITAECESKVTWSSSAPNVAKVDGNGVVTAVGRGTATITAAAENGESASCKVTVKFTWWQWILYIVKTAVKFVSDILSKLV